MSEEFDLREWLAFMGVLLLAISMVGYLLGVEPFHLHPDYSKDPCVGGQVNCLRMNPEFNTLPFLIGALFVILPAVL